MAKTVIILGAGASKECGAPLMAELLGTARDLYTQKRVADEAEHFDRTFQAVEALERSLVKADLDTRNLEVCLTALEFVRILGGIDGLTEADAGEAIESFKVVIARTLYESIPFPLRNDKTLKPSEGYRELLDRFKNSSTAIITFNYDIALEMTCIANERRFTYGGLQRSTEDELRIYKPHGSLNWFWVNEQIEIADVWQSTRHRSIDSVKNLALPRDDILAQQTRGGARAAPPLVIVPPMDNKAHLQAQVGHVWHAAAEELAEAEYVHVFGYSLPPTDYFFRHFLALGSVSKTQWRKFTVDDPDPAVEGRYRTLLSKHSERVFQFREKRFSDACRTLDYTSGR